ncbi:MAG TPA: hypothetical protein VK507_07845 [Iamia sp.]|nr:hypothetical protein [Iamia sp.]
MPCTPEPPEPPEPPDLTDLTDLTGAAERLRSWLDELVGAGDGADPAGLAAWHQAHGSHLIAAALALEVLALDRLPAEPG